MIVCSIPGLNNQLDAWMTQANADGIINVKRTKLGYVFR